MTHVCFLINLPFTLEKRLSCTQSTAGSCNNDSFLLVDPTFPHPGQIKEFPLDKLSTSVKADKHSLKLGYHGKPSGPSITGGATRTPGFRPFVFGVVFGVVFGGIEIFAEFLIILIEGVVFVFLIFSSCLTITFTAGLFGLLVETEEEEERGVVDVVSAGV